MLDFLNKYAGNVHSQNGEDFILRECVKRMGLTTGHCVETGGNDGLWLSNTRLLLESGWTGLFIEADYNLYLKCKQNWQHNPKVRSQCCYVDERNINAFVDERCDLLSLDTDGSDYKIFQGLQARPKIVIMEIDSSIHPENPGFNSDGAAGYFRGVELGLEKGYFLLGHTGNLVLIREEFKHLFPEVDGAHPLIEWWHYFKRDWLREEAA